jgi:protocatechuate 3,4-dioxygenase beta subunit
MKPETRSIARRRVLGGSVAAVAALAFPALASSRRVLPAMTEGPFYPPLDYRARSLDWDADLTTVMVGAGRTRTLARAAGEHLDLFGTVVDAHNRIVDDAEIEIWQCDAFASYRHPRGGGAQVDEGFQGFGATRSDRSGAYRFRTIRPVPYPGRTPHIHVKLRHPAFGELTSQLFVAGDPGNAGDMIYRRLGADERQLVNMKLQRAPASSAVKWIAQRPLIVG